MLSGPSSDKARHKRVYITLTMCIPLVLMGWPVVLNDRTYMIAWLGFFGYLIFFVISVPSVFLLQENRLKYYIALSPFIYLIVQPFGRPLYLLLNGHLELAKDSLTPFYGYTLVYGIIYLVPGYLLIAISWLLWRWVTGKSGSPD